MTGFVRESDEYFAEEKRLVPCVSYRRSPERGGDGFLGSGWRKTKELPADVAKVFLSDTWAKGGEDYPVHTVVTSRLDGKVIDVVRRRV